MKLLQRRWLPRATQHGMRSAAAAVVVATPPPPSRRRLAAAAAAVAQQAEAEAATTVDAEAIVVEWPGLAEWRARGVDRRRGWGDRGATASVAAPGDAAAAALPLAGTLVDCALQALNTADPATKAGLAHRAWSEFAAGRLPLGAAAGAPPRAAPARPARPERPRLVAPKQVPSPKGSPLPLAVHMLHNLAHIELNAIDLALDTCARYAHLGLPDCFYLDFFRVADDESRHFGWTLQRLRELGADYGDLPAHDLLWEGAQLSAGDLNARLAVVPMSQEARGLDAGQRLAERLVGAGDARTAAIVARIADEERAHVAVGVAWFKRVCLALARPPADEYRSLLAALAPELLKGPFNHAAREEVGLARDYYDLSAWPAAARAAAVPPAVAAAAKGRAAPLAAGGGGGECSSSGGSTAPEAAAAAAVAAAEGAAAAAAAAAAAGVGGASKQQDLEELRRRLWRMLETEAAAAAPQGGA